MKTFRSLFQNAMKVTSDSPDQITDTSATLLKNNFDQSKTDIGQSSDLKQETTSNESELVVDIECKDLQETTFDLIRGIIDPEKPQTLEDLDVVKEEDIFVYRHDDEFWIKLEFTPTVPHCSLASLIGLCLRSKLETCLPDRHKIDIYIKEGTHSTADEINKQINDKERIAAAMENPNLRDLVNRCISEEG